MGKLTSPLLSILFSTIVGFGLLGLDTFLSSRLIQFSRSKIQKLISEGSITVNDKTVKKNLKLSYGDIIKVDSSKFDSLEMPKLKKWDYPLEVIYEDNDFYYVDAVRLFSKPEHCQGTKIKKLRRIKIRYWMGSSN